MHYRIFSYIKLKYIVSSDPLILKIMKQNETLISIELVKNHLTEQGKMAIKEAALLYKACCIYLDFTFQRMN
jgi:hypothetical protein